MLNFLKRAVIWFLIAGIVLAALKLFDYDPFGLIGKIIEWGLWFINEIADFFLQFEWFRRILTR